MPERVYLDRDPAPNCGAGPWRGHELDPTNSVVRLNLAPAMTDTEVMQPAEAAAINGAVAAPLRRVIFAMAALWSAILGFHTILAIITAPWETLTTGQDLTIAAAAGVVGLTLLGLGLACKPVSGRVHMLGLIAGLVAVAYGLVELLVTMDERRTLAVILAIIAAGAVLLKRGHLLIVIGAAWLGWIGVGITMSTAHLLTYWLGGLAASSVMAVAVQEGRRRSVLELTSARAFAEEKAVRDVATELHNRRGLQLLGTQVVESARRRGDAVHCLFIDIDGLKDVNDSAGHEAGDAVIAAVAEALRRCTRAEDVVARWGGDEFCVVGPGVGPPPLSLEARLISTVHELAPVSAEVWGRGVSVGGHVLNPWDDGNVAVLLDEADRAMYALRSRRRMITEAGRPRPVPLGSGDELHSQLVIPDRRRIDGQSSEGLDGTSGPQA